MRGFHTLIASDLDGTLLLEPRTPLPPELFTCIHSLYKKGFLFCVASGRSVGPLREQFAPVVNEIVFAAENGARVYAQGELLRKVCIPEPQCWELAADIHALPECEARVCIENQVYRIAKDEANFLHLPGVAAMIPVHTWEQLSGPVTMLTAFCPSGAEGPASVLFPKWKGRVHASMTGPRWLDFSAAEKSDGLRKICERFHIRRERTIAFGNSFNDVSMLDFAARAYIMESACSELRDRFPHHCASVLEVLGQINQDAGGIWR